MNREKTIADVLEIIAEKETITDMRDSILRLATRMKGRKIYPLVKSTKKELR